MFKILLTLFITFLFFFRSIFPAFALISLEEEEKIGKEVLQEISKEIEIIKDIEVNAYVNALGRYLIQKGVSFTPFNFRFFVIKDKTFNAFSVPGGFIFINTGIFNYAESEDEFAAVLAHEISHNLARHVAKRLETIKRMQIATTAATLAAILLGGGQAGQIVGVTGTALAQTKLLSYSRADEEEADRMGFEIYTKAGFNPKAMVNIFERLAKESRFAIELNFRYLLTHPLPQERVTYLLNLAEKFYPKREAENAFSRDPLYFKRLKAKVKALSEDTSDLILALRLQLREKEDPWERYQLALALIQARFFNDAERELNLALKALPYRDYFHLDQAELYFNKGDYQKTIEILKDLTFKDDKLAYILTIKSKYLLARSYMERGDLGSSYEIFKALNDEKIMQEDPYFYFYFGLLCSKMDFLGESHFYFGKFYEKKGDFKTALYHYKRSLSFLEKNSKIYLEAEEKVKTMEKKKP
ncbi:MAG: M48 family metalloprotease [Caldimicrobium sp.]